MTFSCSTNMNVFSRSQSLRLAVVILLVCGTHSKESISEIELLTSKSSRCTYAWAYDMYGAHCAGLQLHKIPSLKSGIEILDFTENRLRELKSDTLSSYTSIKFLYLADNGIYMISDDTFSSMTYLETLDLSRNALMTLPNALFQLPSLRNLYLSGNPLGLSDKTFGSLQRPIRAPLQILDISDCRIDDLPDFGILPQLREYNASQNQLLSLPVTRLAETCNLKKIDLSGSIDDSRLCSLKPAIAWMDQKQIYFILESYTRFNSYEFDNCPNSSAEEEENNTYNTCKARYVEIPATRTSRQTWLTICGGLAGFLVSFILILYLMHRRNVAQTKRTIKKKSIPTSKNEINSKAVLLDVKE